MPLAVVNGTGSVTLNAIAVATGSDLRDTGTMQMEEKYRITRSRGRRGHAVGGHNSTIAACSSPDNRRITVPVEEFNCHTGGTFKQA